MVGCIQHVRARLVAIPLDNEIHTPNYRIDAVWNILVEVDDGEGHQGTSYLWCFGREEAMTLVQMVRTLTVHITGANRSRNLDAVNDEIRRRINFFGYKGVSVFALSAIDMALVDLRCHQHNESLAEMFAYSPQPTPAYWSGLFLDSTIPELLDEVDRALDQGMRAVKLRVGMPDLADDVKRLEAVRTHLPSDATVMLDAVQRWNVNDALLAAKAFAPLSPLWLEDPLVHTDYIGLRDVVDDSPVAIASGENDYLREGFDQVLATGISYALGDLQRVGGITEWWEIAKRCEAVGSTLTSHTYPHVATQLCAKAGSRSWVEYVPWWDALMSYELNFDEGNVIADSGPGIGLKWDHDAVERHAQSPWLTLT